MKTLVDLLEQRADERGDERLVTNLVDGDANEQHLTYRGLRDRARTIGGALSAHAGERALLLYPPGFEYFEAFYGCMYAGVVAVPAYPPNPAALARTLPRLQAIAADARASLILTTSPLRAMAGALGGAAFGDLAWVTTDTLRGDTGWQPPAIGAHSLAFLQYTSGSTDTPKGVMVSHGNLIHNSSLIRDAFGHSPSTIGVGWLPPYHDMGLIGQLIQPLFTGFFGVLMSPLHFLQRPLRWLTAISKYRANTSGGPNFAYELCIRKTTPEQRAALDLSTWDLAFNGAEPIHPDTLARFSDAFAVAGFKPTAFFPCYGLAESTLIATGGDKREAPIVKTFDTRALGQGRAVESERGTALVSSGRALAGGAVAIVDPETARPCAPGQIGEIWLASPSVTMGYFRREEETAATFRALKSGEGTYLRTGDLGFLLGGELFVAGRTKDLIIIRGQNHYPQDIEHTAEDSHAAVRPGCGAAFSVESGGEERLVLAYEIDPAADAAAVAEAVRSAIATTHELETHAIVFVEPRSIPKTSSGKIQRRACRAAYLAGELTAVATWQAPVATPASVVAAPDETALVRWLVDHVHALTGVRVDPASSFAAHGLSSLQVVGMTGELETHLGRRLAPTLAYEHPTPIALARHLAGRAEAPAAPAVATDEPIAIIGIGCRFPQADGPAAFWTLLRDGRDAIGMRGARAGGYLAELDQFDPELFKISQREADAMDPQQRLVLATTWRALEDAGQPAAALAGTSTGVFVGISTSDYGRHAGRDIYSITGNALSIAANRVSYAFDLRGPSMAIDTACSSSLVAVHLACKSLRAGECQLALAGGVNLVLADELTAMLAEAGFLSPDGRCKTFDASANGYVRGEGAGMIVLKPLSRAQSDGDRIYAVIRGTAVNSDGHSNGLTAPNAKAQRAVLERAYADANVATGDVEYVEAHGTGTELGDPIEASALAGMLRPSGPPLAIGSVKTNIGHLEAAAGIAGLIKTALALHHRELPPSLHVRTVNPRLADLAVRVQTERGPWRSPAPIAGVSSFGFGGTNAHAVLAAVPAAEVTRNDDRPRVLPVSAHHPEGVRALAAAYAEQLATASWPEVARAAGARRDHLAHRTAIVAHSAAEAIEKLRAPTLGVRPDTRPAVVFVFSGQGSQWPQIGLALRREPVFAATLEACERALRERAGWSLVAELESSTRITDTQIAQPVLAAVQIALAALWRERGVEPVFVIGHSLGEVAAACVAGALTIDEAMLVAFERGRLSAGATGAMGLVELSAAEAQAAIARFDRLSIAAENAPRETIVSGDPAQLAALGEQLPVRRLPSPYAFHSAALAAQQAALAAALKPLAPRATTIAMISTLTGARIDGTALTAEYWGRQLRERVRFAAAIARARVLGDEHFLELGVPVLAHSIEACGGIAISSLRRGRDDDEAIAEATAALYMRGHDLRWEPAPAVALPPLPFQLRRCWLQEEPIAATAGHPLLGAPLALAGAHVWQQRLDTRRLPYLADHRVEGAAVLPAAAFLELALAAAGGAPLVEVELVRPLRIDDTPRTVQTTLDGKRFRVFSRAGAEDWKLLARGSLGPARTSPDVDIAAIRKRCRETVSLAAFHDSLAQRGLSYGASFRGLVELHRGAGEILGRVELPAGVDAGEYRIHPVVLDACAQVVAGLDTSGRAFMPVGAAHVQWSHAPARAVWSWARVIARGATETTFDLTLADDAGVVARIEGLRIRYLDVDRIAPELYEVRWHEQPLRQLPKAQPGTWLVLADRGGVGAAIAERLGDCIVVHTREELAQSSGRALRGIVDLWGLDCTGALDAQRAHIVDSALEIVKLGAPVWFVTRFAQPVGDEEVWYVPAMLWGLGRTLAQEQPERFGGLVDLGAGTPAELAAALHRELTASDGEQQVAYRGSRRVARLARTTAAGEALSCRADASYLVTGGLGAIGLHVARALVERGARRLILLGRNALPPRSEWTAVLPPRTAAQVATVRELEAAGVAVHLASVDVGDEAQLAGFLDGYRREGWPPIRGVVHLAGVLHDRTLAKLEPAFVAEVCRAKAAGAWLLDRHLREPLDFFVMFSSMAAVLGSAGQASYAAANASLGALAHDRRRHGLPGVALDWGPWAELGLAAGQGDRLGRGGIGAIDPEQGLELFARLANGAPQVAVMAIDWAQLARSFASTARTPFLRDVIAAEPERETDTRRAVLAAPAADREPLILALLGKEIARAVRVDKIAPDVALDALGIDSLMGIELRNRLEGELGISIPIGLLLSGPTIAELAARLAAQLSAPVAAPASPQTTITALQRDGSRTPFFCVHPGALASDCYAPLAERLVDRPFYCIRLAELEASYALDGSQPATPIGELAARSIAALREIQPHGPYLLGGWSLGGVLAFELAHQLEAAGERVARLALFDSPASGQSVADEHLVRAFASYLGAREGHVFPAADVDLPHVLAWAKAKHLLPEAAELAQIESLFASYVHGLRAGVARVAGYEPRPTNVPVAYFRATASLPAYAQSTEAWRALAARCDVIDAPGDHYTMFLPPHVNALADELARMLGDA